MMRFFAGLGRIVSLTEDVLYLLGRSLQRRAVRNGFVVALAYGSALMGVNVVGAQRLENEQVLGLLVAAFASYPAGVLLVRISNLLTRGNIVTAAGGHLHLTSHYKQSQMREHLGLLWDRVFCYESVLSANIDKTINARARLKATEKSIHDWLDGLPFAVRQAMRLFDQQDDDALVERILSSYSHHRKVEATRELFILSGLYALQTPIPQAIQERRVGFDISPLEDWYEKGLFTYEEFPGKAFLRDPFVREIHTLLYGPWRNRISAFIALEPTPAFWYAFTIRKLGVMIGKGIRAMNARVHEPVATGYFNTQHFLWPSDELDEAVLQEFPQQGAALLEELRAIRASLIEELFSSRADVARNHIMRMFLADFRRILTLRLRFDVEYCAGLLKTTPKQDLDFLFRRYGEHVVARHRADKLIEQARLSEQNVSQFLGMTQMELSPTRLRSLRVLYHARRCWSWRRLLPDAMNRDDVGGALARLEPSHATCVQALIRLRTFDALARIQIATYDDLVISLSRQNTLTLAP